MNEKPSTEPREARDVHATDAGRRNVFGDVGRRLDRIARDKPLLCVGAASAAGLVLGGLVFSRAARFMAVVAVGYVANELLHSEGQRGFLPWTDAFERLS